MSLIILTTRINAPADRCFDLSRSIDLHMLSTARTNEVAIAGCTHGLIEQGQTVTWQATHFGIRQKLTVEIAAMNKPLFFSDRMVKGAFKSMYHEHHFEATEHGTIMTDKFSFEAPLGVLGQLFEWLILKQYMTCFLNERNAVIKEMAEGDGWRKLL